MPVWGLWLADRDRFVFSCGETAKKAANIAANPRVVIAVDDTIEVVSVEGAAAAIELDAELGTAFGVKYEPDPDKQAQLAGFFTGVKGFEVAPERAFAVIPVGVGDVLADEPVTLEMFRWGENRTQHDE